MDNKTQINITSNTRRSFLIASTAALLAPTLLVAKENPYGILGQKAPELKLTKWIDAQGKPASFRLAEHKGKYIFMEFWQSWCPGCHSHGFPSLKKISDEFKDSKHFVAVAIQTTFEGHSINTESQMRVIQKRYDLALTMGHDEGKEGTHPDTMKDYRSGGTPWAVLISPDGKVIYNDFSIKPESAIKYLKTAIEKLS